MLTHKTYKSLLILALATIGIQLLIWLPHLLTLDNLFNLNFGNGFATIYRNYDGLNYIVVAKSLYNPSIIAAIPNTLSANYYAAHFPGFSFAILSLAPIFGYLKSMLFISTLFTILSTWALYFLIKHFDFSKQPLFLSLISLVLPARWMIVHSVGSPEPMFIFFTIVAIYTFLSFEKYHHYKWIILTAFFGMLAQITRPPGILLFVALAGYLTWSFFAKQTFKSPQNSLKFIINYLPLIAIPLSLLSIFWLYSYSYHDFWAYFHSGDNIHLQLLPFSVFNKDSFWVGDIWLEDIIYIFMFGFLSALILLKDSTTRVIGFYILTYTLATTLVAHRDISRYILPIAPFAIIAFEKLLTSREFKIVLGVIIFGIYLYSQNFLLQNTAPVPNLSLYN